jgi:hypothetical protein
MNASDRRLVFRLGFFLGYMSGSIISESEPEHEERHRRCVALPEAPSPTRIAL